MEWALASLFSFSAILLAVAFYKIKQGQKVEQREIDTVYMGMMEEMNKLQERIRQLELEGEILAHQSSFSKEEMEVRRQMLDLYKRNYTLEGISAKMELEQEEVEKMLAPYTALKKERRAV